MSGNSPIDFTVMDDADGNGVPEVTVLSRRNSDGRIVAEVKNATGAAATRAVWFMAVHRGLSVDAVPDADGNGVPEIVVLSRRIADGRILVEIKNAFGSTSPKALWLRGGYRAHGLRVLPDLDRNGIDEVGVLLFRESDGRFLVQRRSAAGPQSATDYWFSPYYPPIPAP